MDFKVFIQISFLRETFSTIMNMTYIWFLFGMHPKVIEEVMPFMETSSAIIIFAFQDFYNALGFRVLKLINFELVCFRNAFFY